MTFDALTGIGLKILGVLLLVLLNAFFVGAELALVRIRETQLASLAERGNRRARRAQHIVRHIDAYIGATQFGITLASMGLGVVVEPVFHELLDPLFPLIGIEHEGTQRTITILTGFLVNCYLLIVAGELVPKAIAIRRTLPTVLWVATPLEIFYRISYPFIWVLHRSSQIVMEWLGFDDGHGEDAHSEEEVRFVVATAQNSTDRRDLILNALDLRHRTAREVMRPRNEIYFFDSTATLSECIEIAEKSRYSRFPICVEGDLEQMLGVIHIKDVYPALHDHHVRLAADLAGRTRNILFVPETASLEKLLRLFLDRKLHFGVVVDEFGGTMGIVTLENVLEAIVGQIQDEFDAEATQFIRQSENIWEVAGTLPLRDLEKIIGEVPHDENTTTASGWVTEKLGGFPKLGDVVTHEQFELRVEAMEGTRVAKLKVTKKA